MLQYKWYKRQSGKNIYASRTIYKGVKDGKVVQTTISMHIQIMGHINKMDVDHINHNGLDNQRQNLRQLPHHLNLQNRKSNINSKLGHKNIGERGNRFTVRVSSLGSNVWIGIYNTLDEAIKARDDYRNKELNGF